MNFKLSLKDREVPDKLSNTNSKLQSGCYSLRWHHRKECDYCCYIHNFMCIHSNPVRDKANCFIEDGLAVVLQQCDFTTPYRTYDGTCNNLVFPTWGRVGDCHTRLLRGSYRGETISFFFYVHPFLFYLSHGYLF